MMRSFPPSPLLLALGMLVLVACGGRGRDAYTRRHRNPDTNCHSHFFAGSKAQYPAQPHSYSDPNAHSRGWYDSNGSDPNAHSRGCYDSNGSDLNAHSRGWYDSNGSDPHRQLLAGSERLHGLDGVRAGVVDCTERNR